ncbi:amino acid permease, partial [Pseudomonas syringae]
SLARLSRFQTPHRAIIAGGLIGIAAIYSDGLINLSGMTLTAAMITMAVFGAIVMYIMSMLSLFKLRKTEPGLERTFRAPGYPVVPGIALALAVVCLVAMAWFNALIGLIFLGLMAIGFIYFSLTAKSRADAPTDAMLTGE